MRIKEANGHTVKCNEETQRYYRALQAYTERWPKYCRLCKAVGTHTEHNYPYEPDWVDVCSCIEEGLCPRCGTHNSLDEQGTICYSCFWCYGNYDFLPPYAYEECDCWEQTREEEQVDREYYQRLSEENSLFYLF